MDPLRHMLESSLRSPRLEARPQREVPHLDDLLQGRWSVDDLLEHLIDETSTAASVGSGTDRALGGGPLPFHADEDDEEQFQEDLRGVKHFLEANPMHADNLDLVVHLYLEQNRPGTYTRETRKRLVSRLRRIGY